MNDIRSVMLKQLKKFPVGTLLKMDTCYFHTFWKYTRRKPSRVVASSADFVMKTTPWTVEEKEFHEERLELERQNRIYQRSLICYEQSRRSKAYEIFVPSRFSQMFITNKKLVHYYLKEIHQKDYEGLVAMPEDVSNIELVETENLNDVEKNCEKKTLTIRIKPNNVFCTLKNETSNKTISGSSTKYKIKMSKKILRYNYKIIVRSFLQEIKKLIKSDFLIVHVTSPKRIRKELFRILKKKLIFKKKSPLNETEIETALSSDKKQGSMIVVYNFHARKCFNGCRVKKKRRKKQRGLRIYK